MDPGRRRRVEAVAVEVWRTVQSIVGHSGRG